MTLITARIEKEGTDQLEGNKAFLTIYYDYDPSDIHNRNKVILLDEEELPFVRDAIDDYLKEKEA